MHFAISGTRRDGCQPSELNALHLIALHPRCKQDTNKGSLSNTTCRGHALTRERIETPSALRSRRKQKSLPKISALPAPSAFQIIEWQEQP